MRLLWLHFHFTEGDWDPERLSNLLKVTSIVVDPWFWQSVLFTSLYSLDRKRESQRASPSPPTHCTLKECIYLQNKWISRIWIRTLGLWKMHKMKTIKSRSEAIRVYKNVRSKRVVLEGTEGALRQAVLRNIGQTPGSYMQGLSWVGEGLHFRCYNRSPIPAGKAPWPLSRLLPFEVPCGEMKVVRGRRRVFFVTWRLMLLQGTGPSSEEQPQESFYFQVIFISNLETTIVCLHLVSDVCYKHTTLWSKFSKLRNQGWGFLTS